MIITIDINTATRNKLLPNIFRNKFSLKSLSNTNKAFIYHSNGHSPIVKNLINKKQNDVVLLNVFNHKNLKKKNQN